MFKLDEGHHDGRDMQSQTIHALIRKNGNTALRRTNLLMLCQPGGLQRLAAVEPTVDNAICYSHRPFIRRRKTNSQTSAVPDGASGHLHKTSVRVWNSHQSTLDADAVYCAGKRRFRAVDSTGHSIFEASRVTELLNIYIDANDIGICKQR